MSRLASAGSVAHGRAHLAVLLIPCNVLIRAAHVRPICTSCSRLRCSGGRGLREAIHEPLRAGEQQQREHEAPEAAHQAQHKTGQEEWAVPRL